MKRLICLLAVSVALAGAASGDEGPWFDLENCTMCQNLLPVVEHVNWEIHVLRNGMLSVTVVEPAHAEAWAAAHKEMEAVGQKLMAGEQLPLCNFCQSMGAIVMAGAQWENIDSEVADAEIMLLTSADPKVAEMIQKHAKRTKEEYGKMVAAEDAAH